MHDWKWSQQEKGAARKAFDMALQREMEAVIRQAKKGMAQLTNASELWKLSDWLSERRIEIDRKYDYRYSVLPIVFAALIREGWLSADDLSGIAPDKIDGIVALSKWR